MEVTLDLVAIFFFVALLAGFIDAIGGGGGLIILPALLLAGLSPAQALATNKFQAIFGKISSVGYFAKQGFLDISSLKVPLLFSFLSAGFGAFLVQRIPSSILGQFLPFMILAAMVYILLSPRLADFDTQSRISMGVYSFTFGALISFYDGFFGPASGSFFVISFVALLGFSTAKAVAHAKLLLLVTNLAAVLMFMTGGEILWTLGGAMAAGQWIGAKYGSKLVHHKGSKVVKPALIAVCSIMLGKLVYANLF
ncbi:TSUP family transporter [Photobacterium rosenbergii]|uniref:Probable membrane transporter protein n=1 Tax=Photobacterium rosenbergii TaxID=294936 RepID=A0ABU3ZFH2_9GAMM|nr:TSUP family transporter [Photobacterium rosenbergii]MDV5168673.1 TSUP family transporter [Photobacterium rosenbergii]